MLAVGIDIGGTKIAAGVVDETGTLLQSLTVPTQIEPAAIENSVATAVAELRSAYKIGAVGVAAAGFVAPTRDEMLFSPNIAWRDYPLRERLAAHIDLPIIIENDANAAGWAEYRFGSGRDVNHMVMLTVGTGLGGALVMDGKLIRGAFGAAAEVGHIKIVPHGHYCGCGHDGCWEMYASGNALTRAARQRAITHPELSGAIVAEAEKDGKKIKGPHVTKAAVQGDALASELIAELGTWLGLGMASVAALLDPSLFVIGGGVATAGETVLTPVRRSFDRNLSARGHRPTARIELAELGNDAGMIGAADLARL